MAFSKPEIPLNNLNDIVTFAGTFEVKEKLYGPIDLSFDNSRCSLDMKSCEKFLVINFREGCRRLTNTTLNFSYLLAAITPRLVCPVAAGNYTIKSTELNLKFISLLPIDGYIYNTIAKVISTDPVKKTRKLAWCSKLETKVVKVRITS